jgi:SSS family solute:Na+ symporter
MPLIILSRIIVLERSDLFSLPIIDLIVIALYFSLVIAIGIWSARRIRNQEDYFLAGRRFGKFIQTFAAFGQGTSADNAVGVTTTTFTNGISGIWSSLLYLFATPLYWMVMPWMRRLRLLTLGDFFEERYGSKPMAGAYAVIGSIGMMTIISVGFAAMTKTVVALTPKSIDVLTIAEQTEYEQAQELDHLKAQDFQSLTEQQKTRLRELTLLKPRKLFSHMNPDVLIWIVRVCLLSSCLCCCFPLPGPRSMPFMGARVSWMPCPRSIRSYRNHSLKYSALLLQWISPGITLLP